MRISSGGNLIVELARPGVRVMRFARPDLRRSLDEAADSAPSPLFREIQAAVLSDLPKGWMLVLNMGLVFPINAALYRCLLQVRKYVKAVPARLVLCGLTEWHREIFDLFRGPELFTIVSTEAEARRMDIEKHHSQNSLPLSPSTRMSREGSEGMDWPQARLA